MNTEDIEGITEVIKEYLPVVRKVIPLIAELKDDLKPLINDFSDYLVDLQLRSLRRFKDAGLDHDDAMKLVLNQKISLADALNNMKK